MIKFIKELSLIFDDTEIGKFYILQIYVILLALSEFSFIFIIGNLLSWMEGDTSNFLYLVLEPFLSFFENKDYAFVGLSISFLIFSSIVSFLSAWVIAMFPNKIGALISSRLYFYYIYKNWNFHEKIHPAACCKLSQEANRLSNQIIHPITQFNARVVLAVVFIGYLFTSYPEITVVAGLSLLTLYVTAYLVVNKLLRTRGKIVSETHKKSITYMTYGFQGFIDFYPQTIDFFSQVFIKKI